MLWDDSLNKLKWSSLDLFRCFKLWILLSVTVTIKCSRCVFKNSCNSVALNIFFRFLATNTLSDSHAFVCYMNFYTVAHSALRMKTDRGNYEVNSRIKICRIYTRDPRRHPCVKYEFNIAPHKHFIFVVKYELLCEQIMQMMAVRCVNYSPRMHKMPSHQLLHRKWQKVRLQLLYQSTTEMYLSLGQ